jgi:hypothetical protein
MGARSGDNLFWRRYTLWNNVQAILSQNRVDRANGA